MHKYILLDLTRKIVYFFCFSHFIMKTEDKTILKINFRKVICPKMFDKIKYTYNFNYEKNYNLNKIKILSLFFFFLIFFHFFKSNINYKLKNQMSIYCDQVQDSNKKKV